MYSTCLFCNKHLGTNEVIESFPIGRRLAFDAPKGRLWVVCKRCEKWNLSPFDQRWEALEDCERQFRAAKKRVSTDHIGLARLDEGLELVRIGEPLRPEFAAWRYGDQFGRRRRNAIIRGAGIAAFAGAMIAGGIGAGVLAGGGYWIYEILAYTAKGIGNRRLVARIPLDDGEKLTVRLQDLRWVRLLPGAGPDDLQMEFWHPTGGTVVTGERALHAATLIMPKVNRSGASPRTVQQAVKRIESSDDPVRYLHLAAAEAQQQISDLAQWSPRSARMRAGALDRLPTTTRLAIEMAANEENERCILAGELALLEMAWREAEDLAQIADTLALPHEVGSAATRGYPLAFSIHPHATRTPCPRMHRYAKSWISPIRQPTSSST